jgi:hypothetical protein
VFEDDPTNPYHVFDTKAAVADTVENEAKAFIEQRPNQTAVP